MKETIVDIEDLSQLLRVAASSEPLPHDASVADSEDLSIPIIIETPEESDRDPTLTIVDTLTSEERALYRFEQGHYLRYRMAVLGIGQAVEEVYARLQRLLGSTTDPLSEELNLWVRYQIALFGGNPREGGVSKGDADLLASSLAAYQPNYLVLVNAGQVKNRFAEKTPQQLSILTHHINQGALARQQPYTVVLVTDRPIASATFAQYNRICQRINTYPAEAQFLPHDIGTLVEHATRKMRTYADKHLKLHEQRRPAPGR